VLEEHRDFQLVFLDGQRWNCHLLAWGRHELLVQTVDGRYLVPQHAIAYIALEGQSDRPPEMTAVATVPLPELVELATPPATEVFTADVERPDPPTP
jgi:hypothetical protein